MAHHVGIGEVADDDVVLSALNIVHKVVSDPSRSFRAADRRSAPSATAPGCGLPRVRLLDAAVEEVAHVRILLGFGDREGQRVGGHDLGKRLRGDCGGNTTGKVNVRSYCVIVVMAIGFGYGFRSNP